MISLFPIEGARRMDVFVDFPKPTMYHPEEDRPADDDMPTLAFSGTAQATVNIIYIYSYI